MRVITVSQWRATPDDYKTVIDGQKYIMVNTKKFGTALVPVVVKK